MIRRITVNTPGKGLHEITAQVAECVAEAGLTEGLCTIFVRHTSASLIVQENADPDVRRDLQEWIGRLVRPNEPFYTHTAEGPDDMPSHIKSALTASSVSVPILGGRLALGTWQGILLWEHRGAQRRELLVHIQ